MPPEYEDIEELRVVARKRGFGKLEIQIHDGSFISIAVTTVMKRAMARKDRVVVHTPTKST